MIVENAGDILTDVEEVGLLNHGINEVEETGLQKDGDDVRTWPCDLLAMAF